MPLTPLLHSGPPRGWGAHLFCYPCSRGTEPRIFFCSKVRGICLDYRRSNCCLCPEAEHFGHTPHPAPQAEGFAFIPPPKIKGLAWAWADVICCSSLQQPKTLASLEGRVWGKWAGFHTSASWVLSA